MLGTLMPAQVHLRPATDTEKAALADVLRSMPTVARRVLRGAENALVLWAASLLGLVALWLAAAWLAGRWFSIEFGLRSDAAVWVLGVGVPVCAVYALGSSARWLRQWSGRRPLIEADVQAGLVNEEHYEFTAVKRFQELEHGGLIYFLRTPDDKVLTLFDHESQDLGAQQLDPLKSCFQPTLELIMVRAPKSDFVIERRFLGTPLELDEPSELSVSPRHWPHDGYTDIPWNELEARL